MRHPRARAATRWPASLGERLRVRSPTARARSAPGAVRRGSWLPPSPGCAARRNPSPARAELRKSYMVHEEEDWVGEEATRHRGADDCEARGARDRYPGTTPDMHSAGQSPGHETQRGTDARGEQTSARAQI
jgi:hypothetical protein